MPHKKHVYKAYENIAAWFDVHRSRELFEKPYLDKALSCLPHEATVLDLGCGMGEPIAQYFLAQGCRVTGIDGSEKLIALAQQRHPEGTFIVADMRNFASEETFDCVIAWHSFFHLPQDDQRTMFIKFAAYLRPGGMLVFTSGVTAGEEWSDNGGENLYHASLAADEYNDLLRCHGFELVEHAVEDPACGGATVWIAQKMSTGIKGLIQGGSKE